MHVDVFVEVRRAVLYFDEIDSINIARIYFRERMILKEVQRK
jgi:hypothetical protein